jgi:hypothetical protein
MLVIEEINARRTRHSTPCSPGWRDQQLSRNLNATTIADRDAAVRRFQRFTNEYPWTWRPQDLEEFTAELRGGDLPAALSTIRGYQPQ